jgi:uncharacterized membrane protein
MSPSSPTSPRPSTARPATPHRERFDVALTWAVLLLSGLSAGFFVTWEISAVRGLALLDDPGYVAAMNAMNDTVRTPWFAAIFFGTGLVGCVLLAVRWRGGRPWRLSAAATVVYLAGVIALTAAVNLPMNRELGETRTSGTTETAAARADYEGPWRDANRIRVAASLAAFTLFIGVFREQSRAMARQAV